MFNLSGSEIFGHPGIPMAAYRTLNFHPTDRVSTAGVQLIFVVSGGAQVRQEAGQIDVTPGSIVAVRQGAWIWGMPAGYVATVTLYFRSEFLRSQVRWIPSGHPLREVLDMAMRGIRPLSHVDLGTGAIGALTPKLHALTTSRRDPTRVLEDIAKVAEIFDDIGRLAGRAVTPVPGAGRSWSVRGRGEVLAAIGLLRSDPQRRWSVAELSREVSLSTSQFSRLFRREVGTTPAAFVWLMRVELLAEILATRDMTITKAVREAGWESASAASRAFKRRYGVSPIHFVQDIRSIRS